MRPYLVLSLPRSRSFWLSRLLGCAHDPSRFFKTAADIGGYFQTHDGAVDTGMALIMGKTLKVVPNLRVITIRRSVDDCLKSILNLPFIISDYDKLCDRLVAIDECLDELESWGANSIQFDDLNDYTICDDLVSRCTGLGLNRVQFDDMRAVNLQADLGAVLNDLAKNHEGMQCVYGDISS